jgi:hypothetical protein
MKLIIIDSKGKSNPINIMESDSVEELKNQIKLKNNINHDIELLFNGKILENKDSLFEEGISDNSIINYLGIFKAGKTK